MPDIVEKPVEKYNRLVAAYDNEFKRWEARVTKIIKRYRDDERVDNNNETSKFNILWSNVQTLTPAVFARLPKADVARRFGDNDPAGRVAALLIERALDFEVEHYPDFRATMKNSVEDRFLGGRGSAWVRYEPHVRAQAGEPEDGLQVTEDTDEADEAEPVETPPEGAPANPEGAPADLQDDTQGDDEAPEEIDYECAPTDYVHWKDFGHSLARTWEEVTAVWRWVYMGEAALIERFGAEAAAKIPKDSAPDQLGNPMLPGEEKTQAKICELWDKDAGKVYWFSKNGTDFIDERADPLGLEGFFPCPKPLYATLTSDTLVPVPDFALYQDQAHQLNILSDRIDGLVKALRVRGVYDASVPELQRLFTEGDNLTLIPVDRWSSLAEKGGLKGAVDLLPVEDLAKALTQCYAAFQQIINQVHEITGISDIIRGQSVASETATAQQIKGQYAGLRLRAMQQDVAMYATELLRLKAQIICTKFQPNTILSYAAATQLSKADQALVPQAVNILQSDLLRGFRIEVAADSLVQLDEEQEKKDRVEFLGAFGGFMEQALPVAQAEPKLLPLIIDLLKFGIGAFKGARQIEGTLDGYLSQIKQAQQQAASQPPQPPPPTPEQIEAQAEEKRQAIELQAAEKRQAAELQADITKTQMQIAAHAIAEQSRVDADQRIVAIELQAKMQEAERQRRHDEAMASMGRAFEAWKTRFDAGATVDAAGMSRKTSAAAPRGQEIPPAR